MEATTHHLLMARVAEGDEGAMAELVERWQRPVLAFICRSLGCSDDDARDLAQEVFLRVWRQRVSWQPKAAFSTWLFTIVTNLCRNRYRDLGRRPQEISVFDDGDGATGPTLESPVGDDPHARAEAGELARRLRRALAELPEAQRSALLLRRFQTMSYRQIAEVLGCSEAAVDSLLIRARRNLSASLAQDSRPSGVSPKREENDAL